jgi:RNA polymerase sigma factor (sigma-70 family)
MQEGKESYMTIDLRNWRKERQNGALWDNVEKKEAPLESGDADPRLTVNLYFRQMRRKELLTREQELELGRKLVEAKKQLKIGIGALIQLLKKKPSMVGDVLPSIKSLALLVLDPDPQEIGPVLRRLEEQPMRVTRGIRKYLREGLRRIEAVKETLVLANLRLATSVARRYVGHGLQLLDLVQEGNIGLMRAAEKFDPARGCRFSTYATWWIHQKIRRAVIEQGPTIRIPIHTAVLRQKVRRLESDLAGRLGRRPLRIEVAKKGGMTLDRLEDVDRATQAVAPLHYAVGEDEVDLQDFLVDESLPSPDEQVEQREFREEVSKLLETLPGRDAGVIRMRFGIGFEREFTLGEVGRRFGITRERARQIEARALQTLRRTIPRKVRKNLARSQTRRESVRNAVSQSVDFRTRRRTQCDVYDARA